MCKTGASVHSEWLPGVWLKNSCVVHFIIVRVCNSHMVSAPAIWTAWRRQSAVNMVVADQWQSTGGSNQEVGYILSYLHFLVVGAHVCTFSIGQWVYETSKHYPHAHAITPFNSRMGEWQLKCIRNEAKHSQALCDNCHSTKFMNRELYM